MTTSPVSPAAAAKELLARRNARRSLLDFTRYTKPDYKVNWHHQVLARALDAWVAGEIRYLIVTMPPRHGKSELVSRRLPAYILGRHPTAEIIASSYAASLASAMNRDTQRIIDTPRYQNVFPDTQLSGRHTSTTTGTNWLRNADMFEVVGHGGSYLSAGVGGGITGRGFDYGIIDDPIKDRAEGNSPTVKRKIWDWYTSTFYTRRKKGARILICMTRWALDDLVGHLLDQQGKRWVVVNFPAVAVDPVGDDDPRAVGEALWPEQFPLRELDLLREQNDYEFAALYQQHPVPMGGGLFKSERIEIVEAAPATVRDVRFYDLAVTAKRTSDYTVGLKLGITSDNHPIILDLYRVQRELPDVHEGIVQNATLDGRVTPVVLEAEKAGIVQLDYLLRDPRLNAHTLRKVTPQGDKYTRAAPIAARVNEGTCLMVRAPWNRVVLDELASFPFGAHDDIVDALSGAWSQLSQGEVEWLIL